MKHWYKIALPVLAIIMSINSCKKGENDPLLSLKSRKSRVAGEWMVSSYLLEKESITTPSSGDASTTTIKELIEGEDLTIETSYTNPGIFEDYSVTEKGTVHYDVTFEKDGTWSSSKEYDIAGNFSEVFIEIQKDTNGTEITTTTYTTSTSVQRTRKIEEDAAGAWSFVAGTDEYKNKERIVLNTTGASVTEMITDKRTTTNKVQIKIVDEPNEVDTIIAPDPVTGDPVTVTSTNTYNYEYLNGENSAIWHIDRLAGKEMTTLIEIDQKSGSSNVTTTTPQGGSSTSTNSSSITTTKGSGSITLIQGEAKEEE